MSEHAPTTARNVPVGNGVAAGTLTFALGYVLTYLLQSGSVRESLRGYNAVIEFFGGDPIPAWKAVGWLFYNAHYVAVTFPALGGGRVSRNLLADGNAPVALYLLPPLLLAGAGFVLARVAGDTEPGPGARSGASVTLGYLAFAVLGLVAFQYSAGDATVHPEYALGVLLAGLVYPLVFGALGGALGAATST